MTGKMPVTIAVVSSSTEAWALVARLEDAGINASVIELAQIDAGFGGAAPQVPVQVAPEDVAAAQRVVEAAVGDQPADVDDVDHADADDAPYTPHGMPLLARIGWVVAVLILLAMFVMFVTQFFV